MTDLPTYGMTSEQSVRDSLFSDAGCTDFAKREIEWLGKATPVITATYPQGKQCFIPWGRFLATRQSLEHARRINSEVCQYVDDHLSEVMHKQVKLDGEDAAIELTLDALNGLLEVLGMEEIKTTRVFEVNLTATAAFSVKVEATNANEAAEMVQTAMEHEFDLYVGALTDEFNDCDLDVCDVTVDYTEAIS